MSFNLYTSSGERARLIAGLRQMAAFLEGNPEVPTSGTVSVYAFPPTGMSDAEKRMEIDVIAARIGTETRESASGHYIASLSFGPVTYQAVAIPRANDSDADTDR